MSSLIEAYALIGDGETACLLHRDGSIDWLCWPRFDDDACFAALLGTAENGRWSIAPSGSVAASSRRYQEDTLIVETEFSTDAGQVRLLDFMPMRGGPLQDGHSSVIRMVCGVHGSVELSMDLRLRFDYGALPPHLEGDAHGFSASIGPDRVVLHAPVRVEHGDDRCTARFTVGEGERLAFVLRYGGSDQPLPGRIDAESALAATRGFWRDWTGRFDASRTDWPRALRRSLITLKALVHQPSGGLVAAPTTSLPEAPGGTMNWDYRYAWLRDSTFTLSSFVNAGYHQEAARWRDWLLRAIGQSPAAMRIMYRVDGARHLNEWQVEALPGYRFAKPVRVGNAASTQHQVDVYGEVLDALSLGRRIGLASSPQLDRAERRIVEHLLEVWHTPGSGIWESRGEPRHYTYSKVMAWVGFDRFIASHEALLTDSSGLALLERLREARLRIHDEVCREGWHEGLGSFTQSYGGDALDASLLLMPLVGFLPAQDPRMAGTIDAIGRELSEDGLIRRTKAPADGPREGAFLACSCWMADCLNLLGRTEEARAQFERVLAVSNDVGLLAEEYNVPGGHLAGNFPQALTHLAVVTTGLSLCGPVISRGGS